MGRYSIPRFTAEDAATAVFTPGPPWGHFMAVWTNQDGFFEAYTVEE